jgi:hypothetical protein
MNLNLSSTYSCLCIHIGLLYKAPVSNTLGVFSAGYNFAKMLELSIVDFMRTGEM